MTLIDSHRRLSATLSGRRLRAPRFLYGEHASRAPHGGDAGGIGGSRDDGA
jgi:hypothetical protein